MPRPDERPDDGLVHAWLDGELGAEEAARVERLVAEDAEWAAAAAEARGLMAASTRILGALDVVAGDVIPRGGSAAGTFAPTIDGSRVPKPHVARWAVPTWMRVAAGVALVAGIGYLGLDRKEVAGTPAGTPAGDAVETFAKQTEGATATSAAEAAAPSTAVDAIGAPDDRARPPAPPARNESDLSARDARRDASFSALAAAPAAPSAAPSVAPSVTSSVTPSATASSPALSAAPAPSPASAGEVAQRLSTSQDVSAAAGARATTGVAGGVGSGTVSRPAAELKEMLPAAAVTPAATVATEREARAKSMQRGSNSAPNAPVERLLDSPSATGTGGALAARTAERATATMSVSGCWRARTTARVDSIQKSLRIIRADGDTLVLALTPVGALARVVRPSVDLLRGQARDAFGDFVDFSATRSNCSP